MSKTPAEILAERFPGEGDSSREGMPTVGQGFAPPARLLMESEFHWFHPPMQGSTFLGVLSSDALWYAGHYVGGRMRLCRSDRCEQCALGVGRQIRYVVCCVDLSNRQVGFLEVGAGPGDILRKHVAKTGSLRMTIVALSRVSRKKNARLELSIVDESLPGWVRDMGPLDVQSALFQTWARADRLAPVREHTSGSG